MTIYELPSLIALVFKLGLLGYAAKSRTNSTLTKTFLVLLVLLSLFNLVEFTGLSYIKSHGFNVTAALWFGFSYFALFIPSIALLLHISLRLSVNSLGDTKNARLLVLLYLPVVVLEFLLLFTNQLVIGFQHFEFTVLRVPGPLYYLFEAFAVAYLGATCVYLVYGARSSRAPVPRVRNRLWLLAMAPMALLVIYLIVANHFGWTRLTSTFYIPIAMTFFLVVTTYATHQYRLFDIEFYIPWSKVRKRKTAFYNRIRGMIAEIADLDSVDTVIERLSDTLRCPVALVGGRRPAVAAAGATNFRIDVPDDVLRGLDHIVVRNEIAEAMPEVHALMARQGIAAVVPFHPRSRYASGWLLLGDSFSEQVYTRRDFKVVEELFDKMADLFIDKLVAMRAQLADAFRQIRVLEQQHGQMQQQLVSLRGENAELAMTVGWLRERQPADALAASSAAHAVASGVTLTLLGRDKALLKTLRRAFPQLAQYAGAASSGFRRQMRPDVLIAHLGADDETQANALSRFLAGADGKMAVLLYGPSAERFVEEHKRDLLGRVVEALPDDTGEAVWVRRIEAAAELGKALVAVPGHDQPLVGHSQAFQEQMQQAQHLAGLVDALVIKTTDFEQAAALAAYIHEAGGNKGAFRVLRETDVPGNGEGADEAGVAGRDEHIQALVESVREGTLMVADISALGEAFSSRLLKALHDAGDVRVIAACRASSDRDADRLLAPFRPFVLEMPSLRERKQDLPLLVHYFTLQFNLQTGGHRYLTQAELDELMASQYPGTLQALKHRVVELLSQGAPAPAPELATPAELAAASEKTLDQHVADFEARIIGETLKRCGGNKSKAARLLGLRPNTLHYKLERYGLIGEKDG